MMDRGWLETEDLLNGLINRLKHEYRGANKILQNRISEYLDKFKERDKKMWLSYKGGEITKEEYVKWRANKMLVGNEWTATRDALARDLANVDTMAASIINGRLADIYATNMNFATYQIEHGLSMSTSFQLYNRDTVIRLMRDNPGIFPRVSPSIPLEMRWNRQKITSAVTQGILSGNSIPKIADKLKSVTSMSQSAAIRNARTYVTSAQNAGRMDGYHRAESMGIKLQKQWMATLDDRTRHSHRLLDGVHIPVDEEFDNGCRWPGDPNGPDEEIYNCRCTLVSYIEGIDEGENLERNSKLGSMSYDDWKDALS